MVFEFHYFSDPAQQLCDQSCQCQVGILQHVRVGFRYSKIAQSLSKYMYQSTKNKRNQFHKHRDLQKRRDKVDSNQDQFSRIREKIWDNIVINKDFRKPKRRLFEMRRYYKRFIEERSLVQIKYNKYYNFQLQQTQVMRKEHYEKMNLDQIIDYLRNGCTKSVLPSVVVKTPTISKMVSSLEQYRQKYIRYKEAALKKQQTTTSNNSQNLSTLQVKVDFYQRQLQKIGKGKLEDLNQLKACERGALGWIVQFYNKTVGKVNQYYKDYSEPSKTSLNYWQKLQKCLEGACSKVESYKIKATRQQIEKMQMIIKISEQQKQLEKFQSPKLINLASKSSNKSQTQLKSKAVMTKQQTTRIQQLQELLIRSDIDYQTYKKKQKQFEAFGIPSNILAVFQNQQKKFWKVYHSLVKNIYTQAKGFQEIEGDTLGDKCQFLVSEINDVIIRKTNQLRQEIGTKTQNSNTNLYRFFNTIKEYQQNMKSFVNDIWNEGEKTNQGLSTSKRGETPAGSTQNIQGSAFQKMMTKFYGAKGHKSFEQTSRNKFQQPLKVVKKSQEDKSQFQKLYKQQIENALNLKKQNQQLIQSNSQYERDIEKMKKQYEKIKKQYQKSKESSEYWMKEFKNCNAQKNQIQYSLKSKDLQNPQQIAQIFNNSSIMEDFDENEESQKKSQFIALMLKRKKEQPIPYRQQLASNKNKLSKSIQYQQSVNGHQKCTSFQRGTMTEPAREQKLLNRTIEQMIQPVDIKSQLKNTQRGAMNQTQDHTERSSSNLKKKENQIKELKQKIEKYEGSIKSLKKQLQQQKAKNPTQSSSTVSESQKEQLMRLSQLKQTQRKLKTESDRSNQLAKINEQLRSQSKIMAQKLQAEQKIIAKLTFEVEQLKKKIQEFKVPQERVQSTQETQETQTQSLTENKASDQIIHPNKQKEIKETTDQVNQVPQAEKVIEEVKQQNEQKKTQVINQQAIENENLAEKDQQSISHNQKAQDQDVSKQFEGKNQIPIWAQKQVQKPLCEQNITKSEEEKSAQPTSIQEVAKLSNNKELQDLELSKTERKLQENTLLKQKNQQNEVADKIQNDASHFNVKKQNEDKSGQHFEEQQKDRILNEIELKLSQLKLQEIRIEKSINEKKEELQKIHKKLEQCDRGFLEKNNRIKELDEDINRKVKQVAQFKTQIQNLKSEAAKIRKKSEEIPKNQSADFNEVRKGKDQIKSIQDSIKKLLQSKNKVEKQNLAATKACTELGKKEKTLKQNVANLESKLKSLTQKQAQANKIIEEVDSYKQKKSQLEAQISSLSNKISELEQKKYTKQKEVEKCQSLLDSLRSTKEEYNKENAKLQKIKVNLQLQETKLKDVKQQIQEHTQNHDKLSAKYSQNQKLMINKSKCLKQEIEQLLTQIKNYQQKLDQIELSLQQKRSQNLKYGGFPNRHFIGQIIQQQADRQYILNQVEKLHKGKQIVKTKLLFSFPLMKEINPHLTVDDAPNLIFLVKCPAKNKFGNNYIFALYSANPLRRNAPTNNGLGFISAVTNNKTFYLRSSSSHNPRVTQYNEYYIIFGNGEIRFRLHSFDLETNIGHLYKSFDTENYKDGSIFTGDANKETSLLAYEAYQIIFKGEEEKEKIFDQI